jgi:hypothetical protein
MDKKTKIGGIIIAIIIIVIIGLMISQLLPSAGYKVTINGQAGYGTVGGWGLQFDSYQNSLDNWYPFGFWPWETGDIVVDCYLSDVNGDSYHGSQNIGSVNNLNPLTQYKPFHVPIRRVPVGTYHLRIDVYEVHSIVFIEQSRTLWKTFDQDNIEVPYGGTG